MKFLHDSLHERRFDVESWAHIRATITPWPADIVYLNIPVVPLIATRQPD
jgi:hypothetical protein